MEWSHSVLKGHWRSKFASSSGEYDNCDEVFFFSCCIRINVWICILTANVENIEYNCECLYVYESAEHKNHNVFTNNVHACSLSPCISYSKCIYSNGIHLKMTKHSNWFLLCFLNERGLFAMQSHIDGSTKRLLNWFFMKNDRKLSIQSEKNKKYKKQKKKSSIEHK